MRHPSLQACLGSCVRGLPLPSRGACRLISALTESEDKIYLIINLDFLFRRLVVARAVAGVRRLVATGRRALLRTNIGRLPPHAQPRARDAANDVPPKAPPQMNVQKTSEALVEAQPYR